MLYDRIAAILAKAGQGCNKSGKVGWRKERETAMLCGQIIDNWLKEVHLYQQWGERRTYNWKMPINRQLRARRALLQLKDVPLRTRRALLLYKVNGNSALLVLKGTSLSCDNALLTLN